MSKGSIGRRGFLRSVAGGLAATAGSGLVFNKRAAAKTSANNRIRLGVIGCGGMGNRHLDSLIKRTDCEVVAVCDAFKPRYMDAQKKVGGKCDGYQDYRHILDRNDVDAILCASPDHWHALMAIHGCQAWKDVYVEKPLTTSIHEGRVLVDTARRYERVVQVGIQQRSLDLFKHAIDVIHTGKLGQVTSAGAWISPNGIGGYEKQEPIPDGLDWDMWLGPAPYVPFSPQRFGSFRAFHDYANGELTNWGVHLMDIVLWGIRQDYPLSVQGVGANYRQLSGSDDYENILLTYEFKNFTVTWEQSHSFQLANKGYGMKFNGTNGHLYMDRGSYVVEPDSLGIPEEKEKGDSWIDIENHHANFFECIRTRQRPAGDVETAHKATSTVLLGAIALDERRKLNWDGVNETFIDDPQANRHLYRPYRAPWHL